MFLNNLLHTCTVTLSQDDLNSLLERSLIFEPRISANYQVKNVDGDVRTIAVQGTHAALMTSSSPLTSFASDKEIAETSGVELESLYPVSPFIDLEPENIYLPDSTGLSPSQNNQAVKSTSFPHTLFLHNNETLWTQEDFEKEMWTDEHKDARAILFTHALCVTYAKKMYGNDVKTLKQPITAQCIQTNGDTFRFLCYQLNTLSEDRSSVVRNQAWIDNESNQLFLKTILPKQFARDAAYADFEPSVLRKFVTFFTNGLAKQSSGQSRVAASQ